MTGENVIYINEKLFIEFEDEDIYVDLNYPISYVFFKDYDRQSGTIPKNKYWGLKR